MNTHLAFRLTIPAATLLASLATPGVGAAQLSPTLRVDEASVAQIERRFTVVGSAAERWSSSTSAGSTHTTKKGPSLNAIVVINPAALATADSLDRLARNGRFAGPLHCVPTIVKDNFDTLIFRRPQGRCRSSGRAADPDATVVARLRAAAARSSWRSRDWRSSRLVRTRPSVRFLGFTRIPYALDRVPRVQRRDSRGVASSLARLGSERIPAIRFAGRPRTTRSWDPADAWASRAAPESYRSISAPTYRADRADGRRRRGRVAGDRRSRFRRPGHAEQRWSRSAELRRVS